MKFRKKPVVIEAVQWFSSQNYKTFTDSMGIKFRVWATGVYELTEGQLYDKGMRFVKPVKTRIVIDTLEGDHDVSEGDWIITGVKGEKYPCKPDIFYMTYEKVGIKSINWIKEFDREFYEGIASCAESDGEYYDIEDKVKSFIANLLAAQKLSFNKK